MLSVTARLRAKKGEEAALERALCDLARQVTANEPGCLLYRAARSKHDPQLYMVIERYRDEESLAAHANAEHYRNALPVMMAYMLSLSRCILYLAPLYLWRDRLILWLKR